MALRGSLWRGRGHPPPPDPGRQGHLAAGVGRAAGGPPQPLGEGAAGVLPPGGALGPVAGRLHRGPEGAQVQIQPDHPDRPRLQCHLGADSCNNFCFVRQAPGNRTPIPLEMEQAIRDREEWILSGSIEAPDVLAVANKWRHWKPGGIGAQLPTESVGTTLEGQVVGTPRRSLATSLW